MASITVSSDIWNNVFRQNRELQETIERLNKRLNDQKLLIGELEFEVGYLEEDVNEQKKEVVRLKRENRNLEKLNKNLRKPL